MPSNLHDKQGRTRTRLDTGWKFMLAQGSLLHPYENWQKAGDYRRGVTGPGYDDAGWRDVDLPHDFVVEGGFVEEMWTGSHGSKPGGVGWYRRRFNVDAAEVGKRFYLFFDGVFRDSRVYLNGFFVGRHASGYTSFHLDVTDVIEYGGENVLVVRADATRQEGWFYEGGGIYRHVWLVKTAPVHVAPWGTFVSADVAFGPAGPNANVQIRTTLANRLGRPAACRLTSRLVDAAGTVCGDVSSACRLDPLGDSEVSQTVALESPRLWSVDAPYLYTVVSTVEVEGECVDEYRTPTGIRSIRFDPERGFLLNEQPLKIKGLCCHQDHAGVGAALPDRLQEYRLERLKEMGANAYRCAHHPPTPELLDAADRLGVLVMDENRRLSSSPEDLSDLASMIRRDRNHPSVVIWSVGNEEMEIQWTPQARRLTRHLCDRVHQLDPTRPATLAICFWNPATQRTEPLELTPTPSAELDVMGFNYAYEHWEGYHALHPHQPCIISEASSDRRTRCCYYGDPSRGLLAVSDPCTRSEAELSWELVARHPFLSGIFLWTGFDYRGEPGPLSWPAVGSQAGIMDACGFPKDNYFYFKAAWQAEPLVHLYPHWNWPGREGQAISVVAYSNCEEVELLLNGRHVSRLPMPPHSHLHWPDVAYAPGLLEARGYRNGALVATARVETTGAPHGLRLRPDRVRIQADGADVSVVNVAVVDAQGRVVPVADNEIVFQIAGAGRVIGVGNGHPGSHEADKASHRRAFSGWCQVIVQSTGVKGKITLTAASAGLVPGTAEMEAF
jgi:beta-galactosidase